MENSTDKCFNVDIIKTTTFIYLTYLAGSQFEAMAMAAMYDAVEIDWYDLPTTIKESEDK